MNGLWLNKVSECNMDIVWHIRHSNLEMQKRLFRYGKNYLDKQPRMFCNKFHYDSNYIKHKTLKKPNIKDII